MAEPKFRDVLDKIDEELVHLSRELDHLMLDIDAVNMRCAEIEGVTTEEILPGILDSPKGRRIMEAMQ